MYKALILDMDGTTMDTRQMVVDSFQILLDGYGIPMTDALLKKAFGLPGDETMRLLGLDEDPAVTLSKWLEICRQMTDRITLFPGIEAVLAAPIRRGAVTSQIRKELNFNLALLGIEGRFEHSVTADELPHRKPRPEPLLHCLALMNIEPKDALYVGDTVYDLVCARDAGVDFGLASWGADDDMDASGAKFIFQKPEDMLEHIRTD